MKCVKEKYEKEKYGHVTCGVGNRNERSSWDF